MFVGDLLQPTHLLFILVVALLVLGPKRLPEVGRTLGRGLRDFRGAISGEDMPDHTIQSPPPSPTSEQPLPTNEQPLSTNEQPPSTSDETTPVPSESAPTEVQAPAETAE